MAANTISYISPLIITGIAGLTLTSIAFGKINRSISRTVDTFASASNLGKSSWIPDQLSEDEINLLRKLGYMEIIVVLSFLLSEIFVIPSFSNALWPELFQQNLLHGNLSFYLIAVSYCVIIIGFVISAIVYIVASYFNINALPPSTYSENEERKRCREGIPKAS